ncbi:MauE/DoxX family redox-associated membrane protein [Candidatus Nephthysia bennettiae]|uniref:MauE/DoxX family redox-associated membrane protein n=1 Tax=Candidatus Nephthysia bennettiae TaxID=3127016 RepID=UPI003312FC0B
MGVVLGSAVTSVLVTVLLIASVGKLLSFAEFSQTVRELGLSRRIVQPTAVTVILVELALASALLISLDTRRTALLVALLFLTFMSVSVFAVWKGRQIGCNCFGSRHGIELGWITAARGGLLAAMAIGVVALSNLGIEGLPSLTVAFVVALSALHWLRQWSHAGAPSIE